MPWVRFDDQYPIHRKVDGLSDAAFRLHTSAIFWSARNLTDGFVSREDLDGVTARVRTPARFAAECVRRGTWHGARQPCDSEDCPGPVDGDGWIIHDYWFYQPTKEQVMRDRRSNARRQAAWKAKHNGVSNGVSNGAPSRPVKEPPNPPPSGGHDGSHPNCRACGTNRRGPPPEPAPTPTPPPFGEVGRVNGKPARGQTVHAIAAQARTAITREGT